MLPTERATVLREKKTGAEIKPFSKLIPGLLESYNKPNMMKYMVSLDSLISSRLNASERQRKFQELANFEQMARENLEIEKAVRERRKQIGWRRSLAWKPLRAMRGRARKDLVELR